MIGTSLMQTNSNFSVHALALQPETLMCSDHMLTLRFLAHALPSDLPSALMLWNSVLMVIFLYYTANNILYVGQLLFLSPSSDTNTNFYIFVVWPTWNEANFNWLTLCYK